MRISRGAAARMLSYQYLTFACRLLKGLFFSQEDKQCSVQPDAVDTCSCFEVMNMFEVFTAHEKVSEEEYHQRFRRASKLHHPDKNNGEQAHQVRLNECADLLFRIKERRKQKRRYLEETKKAWSKCQKKTTEEKKVECWSDEMQYIHGCSVDELCLLRPESAQTAQTQYRNVKRSMLELVILVLDNSGSMGGQHLHAGKAALGKVMPRLERAPTEVHFIGSSPHCTFTKNVDFTFEDLTQRWNADGGGTYLWGYLYEVLRAVQSAGTLEVVIITDGYDNMSSSSFQGAEGFNTMMQHLVQDGKRPRFRVFCISNDACLGNYYRDLAMASGGTFIALPAPFTEKQLTLAIDQFGTETNASVQKRNQLAERVQQDYLRLAEAGSAKEYSWAKDLAVASSEPSCTGTKCLEKEDFAEINL